MEQVNKMERDHFIRHVFIIIASFIYNLSCSLLSPVFPKQLQEVFHSRWSVRSSGTCRALQELTESDRERGTVKPSEAVMTRGSATGQQQGCFHLRAPSLHFVITFCEAEDDKNPPTPLVISDMRSSAVHVVVKSRVLCGRLQENETWKACAP